MWRSVISSSRARLDTALRARCAPLLWAGAVLLCLAAPVEARVFLTVEEALDLAFPGCRVDRQTVYLTEAQQAAAQREAGVEIPSALVYPYQAVCDGEPGGTAYFDTHRVRTLPETLMIVVDPDGELRRLEIVAFREPQEYIPPEPWYGQFLGRELSDDLRLQREIRAVTGATLTARATTDAVRRTLAVHRLLLEADSDGEGAPE